MKAVASATQVTGQEDTASASAAGYLSRQRAKERDTKRKQRGLLARGGGPGNHANKGTGSYILMPDLDENQPLRPDDVRAMLASIRSVIRTKDWYSEQLEEDDANKQRNRALQRQLSGPAGRSVPASPREPSSTFTAQKLATRYSRV